MRSLSKIEQKLISGGEVNVVVPVDPNTEFNFSSGFNFGINLVGGLVGFAVAIPCSAVVLPAKGVYSVASTFVAGGSYVMSGVYNYFS